MPQKYKGQTAYQVLYGKQVLYYSMARSWEYQNQPRDLSKPMYLDMSTQRVETLRCQSSLVARTDHLGSFNVFGYGDTWTPLITASAQVARRRFSALAQSSAQSLVTALEAGKTLRMVQHRTKGLTSAADALLAGRIKRFEKVLRSQRLTGGRKFALKSEHRRYSRRLTMKRASALWLEYRFGWLPLVYDIDDHMAALADRIPKDDIVRSTGSFPMPAGSFQQVYPRMNGFEGSYDGPVWGRTQTVLGGIVTVSNPFEYYRRRFGVNIYETAWELTPYSWAVDYLVDLQGYLAGISAFAGLSLRSGWQTTVKHQWSPVRVREMDQDWKFWVHDYVYRRFSCRRVAISDFPPYSHVWWDPSRITTKRTINLLAASVQRFIKLKP